LGTRDAAREFPVGTRKGKTTQPDFCQRLLELVGDPVVAGSPRTSPSGWRTCRLQTDAIAAGTAAATDTSGDFRERVEDNAFHLRASLSLRQLSDTRVALPLDVCHFAWHNIHFEGAEMANAAFLSLTGNFVVSGRQGNPKMSLIVGGERCHLALLVFHYESSIRERL
jgi:hypothetical protein